MSRAEIQENYTQTKYEGYVQPGKISLRIIPYPHLINFMFIIVKILVYTNSLLPDSSEIKNLLVLLNSLKESHNRSQMSMLSGKH